MKDLYKDILSEEEKDKISWVFISEGLTREEEINYLRERIDMLIEEVKKRKLFEVM